MKKYYPRCVGFYVLYALVLICFVDAMVTLIGQIRGTLNEFMASFSFFSYLILAMGVAYAWMYVRCRVEQDDATVRFAFPANVRARQGQPRAMIVYRQGECDLKFIDKTVDMKRIVRYGYVEDLGYDRVDAGPSDENKKMFPVHEVAFITDDNKRYHWNAAFFSKADQKAILEKIASVSGVKPEGKLAEGLDL